MARGAHLNAVVEGWAAQLWPVGDELADLFSDWLPRLRSAFGPWRRPQGSDPAGEPDGVSGLTRRGPWERLLTSEWAVALEVPDEFVRRAAMGEQLFLRQERVVPGAAPHTRVWVDCGPTQLGTARLVHLAVLVVLSRRAAEVGGRLSWAPAHDPGAWREGLDPEAVLACRTLSPPAPLPRLVGTASEPVEVFTLGGPDLPRSTRRIEVDERDGDVTVRVGSLQVVLRAPAPPDAARLLSHVVARSRPSIVPRGTGARVDALAFAPGGGALIVRQGDNVTAWAVPQRRRHREKSRARSPWPWDRTPQDRLVAVGWSKRQLLVVRATSDRLRIEIEGRKADMPLPAALAIPGVDHLAWVQAMPARWLTGYPLLRTHVLLRDAAGVVWSLDFAPEKAVPLGRAASDPVSQDGVYGWLRADGSWVRLVPGTGTNDPDDAVRDHGRQESPLFSGVPARAIPVYRKGTVAALAAEVNGSWWVGPTPMHAVPRTDWGTNLGAAERVVGAVWAVQPALLVWREGSNILARRSPTEPGFVVRSRPDDPVVAAAVGGRQHPLLAVGTASGHVEILPLLEGSEPDPWLTFLADSPR